MCGFGAGACETVVTYPVHKLILRQQIHGFEVHKAVKQLVTEGRPMLYRGVLPPMVQVRLIKRFLRAHTKLSAEVPVQKHNVRYVRVVPEDAQCAH